MVRAGVILAFAAAPTVTFADQPPSHLEVVTRAEQKMRAEVASNCIDGNAMDQAACFKLHLEALDKELDELVARAIRETDNMWGQPATDEQRQNIKDTQAAWKTYRREHCWFDYVPHQWVNASSRQLDNFACEVWRTYLRMEEIRIDYMGDWR